MQSATTVTAIMTIACVGLSRPVRHGGLTPPVRPHELTASALETYVRKTFGPSQRCLTVTAENTADAAAVVAMLHGHRDGEYTTGPIADRANVLVNDFACQGVPNENGSYATAARTIALVDGSAGPGDATFCLAHVVVGRHLPFVADRMERFGKVAVAERMLVIVVQDRNNVEPFVRYSPAHFNYKDVVLINACPRKETVYQMSMYHGRFVPISKRPDQWFAHDLIGKQRVKNFYGTRIKLLAYNNSFFSSVTRDDQTGELSLSHGVECDIFKEIAARLNVTWVVYTTPDTDMWGTLLPNKSVTGGALKFLHDRRVDVAFCSLWIDRAKYQLVDMSRFWTLACLKFLVPKAQPLREKWDLLVKPFPCSVWLLLLSSAVLTTIAARALAGVQKRIGYATIDAFTSLSSTVFWIIGMTLLTNIPRAHRMGPVKHLISWWCIFTFIMSTLFCSTLYSYITSPAYTDIALEIGDMLRANYRWGLTYPPPLVSIFNMQDPVHRAFSERFVPERGVRDRIGRLKEGGYAVLTKCLYGKHFMESDRVPAALLSDLRTGRACLSQFYVGLGFVRRSPYVRPANLVVQRIFESGLVDYWLGRVAGAHASSTATFRHVYEIRPPRHDATPRPLSYTQFKVVVVAWTVGCALSAVVFVAELRRFPSDDWRSLYR